MCVSQGGNLSSAIPPNKSSMNSTCSTQTVGIDTITSPGSGTINLQPMTQTEIITPAPVRYFTLHHPYNVTTPLSVQMPGNITVKARDRYGNMVTGDVQNGQYYTGSIMFSQNGSSTTITLKAMPGSATFYTFVKPDPSNPDPSKTGWRPRPVDRPAGCKP